jgi:hypothetical protein
MYSSNTLIINRARLDLFGYLKFFIHHTPLADSIVNKKTDLIQSVPSKNINKSNPEIEDINPHV